LGFIQLQKNRPLEAAQYFRAALKQSPNYRPALLNLAVVSHQHLNARPVALQKYREYLELKPRPANWEAVNATANALESQLSPPKSPSPTNPVAAVKVTTNAVTKPPDSLPRLAATNLAKSEPPPSQSIAATPTKLSPPIPKPAAPPVKVDVVKVPEDSVVKPAQDIFIAPTPDAVPEPVTTTKAASPTATEVKVVKKGFFQRVNPVNLFRREPKAAPIVTPLNAPVGPSSTKPVEVAAISPKPQAFSPTVATNPPSSLPAFNRYAYRSPRKPVAGSRSDAEASFAQGVQAQRDHRPAAAVTAYRAATTADPSFFEAQYNLGLAAFEAGDLPQSLIAYEQALAVMPDSANARYNFALALKEANYPVDAATELEKLLTAHPDEARAQLALANLYAQQLNQPLLARAHYLKVLTLDPQHPQSTAIRYWLAGNPK
jgi:tetratricopeptide (TPR) repeat protein